MNSRNGDNMGVNRIDNKTVKHKNDQEEQFKGQANLVNT